MEQFHGLASVIVQALESEEQSPLRSMRQFRAVCSENPEFQLAFSGCSRGQANPNFKSKT